MGLNAELTDEMMMEVVGPGVAVAGVGPLGLVTKLWARGGSVPIVGRFIRPGPLAYSLKQNKNKEVRIG